MAILSLGNANKSLYATRKKTSLASKTIRNISNILTDRSLKRKNLTNNILNYKNKRIQKEKRDRLQEAISAPIQVTKLRGPASLSLSQTGQSFTERILGFVGFISAGWLLSNMPTWTSLGSQLIERVRTITPIMSDFTNNIGQLMVDIGSVANGFYQNMKALDFSDSNNLVRTAMSNLSFTLQTMGDKITEAFDALTAPFINVPPLGSKGEPGAYPDTTPPGQNQQPPASGGGGGKWKPLLDVIGSGEGGYTSIYPSDQNPNLTKMTIAEASRAVGQKGGRGAIGKYQFTSPISQAKFAKLNPDKDLFSPANQDKMAVAIIENKRGGNDWLAGKITDEQFGYQLAREFAGLKQPNGIGFYDGDGRNKASVDWKVTKSILQKVKSSPTQPSSTPAPSNLLETLAAPSQRIIDFLTGRKPEAVPAGQRPLAKGDILTKSLGEGVDYIEIGDLYGSRGGKHGGIDILIPHGTYIALRVDCEVVAQGEYGNYGLVMDVWVPSYGVQLRMAHLSSVLIKSGKIPAGTSFARVGRSGNATAPHIHFEYDTVKGQSRGGGAGNPEAYVRLLILTKSPNKSQFSPPPSSIPGKPSTPTTPLAPQSPSTTIQTPEGEVQVEANSPSTLDDFLVQITPERKGQQIIFINDIKPAGTKVMMGAGGSQTIPIGESDIVNNFIKNKLLLDLNYL